MSAEQRGLPEAMPSHGDHHSGTVKDRALTADCIPLVILRTWLLKYLCTYSHAIWEQRATLIALQNINDPLGTAC